MTKVLRVGIIKSEGATPEVHLFHNVNVTLGDLGFKFLAPQLKFKLFEFIDGKYVLNFNEHLKGRIGEHKLDSPYWRNLCTTKEGVSTLPLNDLSRGRVSYNDHAVLFQFVDVDQEPTPVEPQVESPKDSQVAPKDIDLATVVLDDVEHDKVSAHAELLFNMAMGRFLQIEASIFSGQDAVTHTVEAADKYVLLAFVAAERFAKNKKMLQENVRPKVKVTVAEGA